MGLSKKRWFWVVVIVADIVLGLLVLYLAPHLHRGW